MKIATRLRRSTAGTAGPASAYAGILDGETLWLAVDATPGRLALRDPAGAVHLLTGDSPDDDPAHLSVRASLLDLPGADDVTYDVVLVPADGGAPRPVSTAPLVPGRTVVPPARSGTWHFGLRRADDGTLQVHRGHAAPACDLVGVSRDGDGIRLTLRPAAVHDPALLLMDGGEVVATYPVAREDDTWVAVLTTAGLPQGCDQVVRLAVGSGADRVPVRRRANDLRDPNAAVLLPQLEVDGDDVLRLRYAPDGTLAARLLDPTRDGDA